MRVLLHILVHVLLCCLGLALLVGAFVPELLNLVGTWLLATATEDGGRLVIAGTGFGLACLPLAQLLAWWRRHVVARELSYQTADGEIILTLVAIEEALERSLAQVHALKKSSIEVHEDRVRRQVVVSAVLSLWEDADIAVVNRQAQALLRQRFAELMPEMPGCLVKVTVARLSARRNTDQPRQTVQPHVSDEPVNAPEPKAPLPGLAKTKGAVDGDAGKVLLASTGAQVAVSHHDHSHSAAASHASLVSAENTVAVGPLASQSDSFVARSAADANEAGAAEGGGVDPDLADYGDLYVGPQYSVADDDEDDHASGVKA